MCMADALMTSLAQAARIDVGITAAHQWSSDRLVANLPSRSSEREGPRGVHRRVHGAAPTRALGGVRGHGLRLERTMMLEMVMITQPHTCAQAGVRDAPGPAPP
eukprot:scaffold2691_cov417-Prasinococcus_capsulatus_cf.AAC.7